MDTPSADAELLISIYWNEHKKILILIWICWIGNEEKIHFMHVLFFAVQIKDLLKLVIVSWTDGLCNCMDINRRLLQVIVDLLTHNKMYICMCLLANAVISLACLAPNWYICRSEHAEAWRKGANQLYNATFWVPKCWS